MKTVHLYVFIFLVRELESFRKLGPGAGRTPPRYEAGCLFQFHNCSCIHDVLHLCKIRKFVRKSEISPELKI